MLNVIVNPIHGAGEYEHCCMCRNETKYWYKPKDVALCQSCAKGFEEKDIPSKEIWCRRESVIYRTQGLHNE